MSSILDNVELTFQSGDIEVLKRCLIELLVDELQMRDTRINNLQNRIDNLSDEIAFLHVALKSKVDKVNFDDFEFQMKTIYGN